MHGYTQALLFRHDEVYAVLKINQLPYLHNAIPACAANKVVLIEFVTVVRAWGCLLLGIELAWAHVFEVERAKFMLRVVTGL